MMSQPELGLSNKTVYVWLIAILLLAFGLRLYLLNEAAFNHDEEYIYDRLLTKQSSWQLVTVEYDVGAHALAYLLAKSSMDILGDTLFSLRWFSAMLGFLSILLIYKIGAWLANRWLGLLAAFLLAISPYAINYVFSYQGYASMIFYVLLAYFLAIRAIQTKAWGYWLLTALTLTAAIYNHQYSALAWPGIVWLLLIDYLRRPVPRGSWLKHPLSVGASISLVGVIMALAPILLRVINNGTRSTEFEAFNRATNTPDSLLSSIFIAEVPETPASFWTTLSWFSVVRLEWPDLNPNPTILYLLVGLALLATGLAVWRRQAQSVILLWGWLSLPFMIYTVAGWILPDLWARPKHFGFTLPFFLLLVALAPLEIGHRLQKYRHLGRRGYALLSGIILIMITGLWIGPMQEIIGRHTQGNWPQVATAITPYLEPTDLILCEPYDHGWSKAYPSTNEVGDCIRNLSYWLDTKSERIYPILALGEATDYKNITSDLRVANRVNRVWLVVWNIPAEVDLPPLAGQTPQSWHRFGRTALLVSPPQTTVAQGLMTHLDYLAHLPHTTHTPLMYEARLAQIANLLGYEEQANQTWQQVEANRGESPELAGYLDAIHQTLDDPPLLRQPNTALEISSAGGIQFDGYTLAPRTTILPGQTLDLTLFWRATHRPQADYTIFIHIYNELGQTVFQDDFGPGPPTAAWWPGDVIWSERSLNVPQDMPAGEYKIYTGMYLLETLDRLPFSGPQVQDDAIFLTTLQVQ